MAAHEMLDRTADAIHELLGYPNVDLPLVEEGEPPVLVIRARGGGYKEIRKVDRLPIARGVMGAAQASVVAAVVNLLGATAVNLYALRRLGAAGVCRQQPWRRCTRG